MRLITQLITILSFSLLRSSQLCKQGETWQQLHIVAGSYVTYQLSGIGSTLYIQCLSGFIWDLASGHPKLTLELYQGVNKVADLTNAVNNTGTQGLLFTGPSETGQWSLVATNNNRLWNADVTLVISYQVRNKVPTCTQCSDPTKTGKFCNESCPANCYSCCQDSPSTCVICALGRSGEPQCQFSCRDDCLICDNMGGCHFCKDLSRAGPNCDQCRPLPCQQPNFVDCTCPVPTYPFCKSCENSFEAAERLLAILSQFFDSEAAARVNIAAAQTTCLALIEFFALDILCDIAVFTALEAGELTSKWVIKYLFTEELQKHIAKASCQLLKLCPNNDLMMNEKLRWVDQIKS